jgi:hypothetical protein
VPTRRVLYTRPTGKRLTYQIDADERGRYAISVGGTVVKRGMDPLVERRLRPPGDDVLESTIAHSQVAIMYLIGMKEE